MPDEPSVLEPIAVDSEEEAWAVLEETLRAGLDLPASGSPIRLEGWPKLVIYVPDAENYTIGTPMMKAIVEIQDGVYRSAALLKYGSADIRSLSEEDKLKFELKVTLRPGSSWHEIDFQELLTTLGVELVGKMSSEQILGAILGIGVMFTGYVVTRSILQYKLEKRKEELKSADAVAHLQALNFASEQETARMQVLSSIIARQPPLAQIMDQAENSHSALLRAAELTGNVEIAGVALNSATAAELRASERRSSNEDVIDGEFRVLGFDTSDPQQVSTRLRHLASGAEFTATFQDAILGAFRVSMVAAAAGSRGSIFARVRVRRMENEIRQGVIAMIFDLPPQTPPQS
jgi:hypothetical protein